MIVAARRLAGAVALIGCALPAHAASLEMAVSLDPATRTLSATAVIALPAGPATELALDRRYDVSTIAIDGRSIASGKMGSAAASGETPSGERRRWRIEASAKARRLEIAWGGRLDALNDGATHRDTLRTDRAVADERGSFLPAVAYWHPIVSGGFSRYEVSIDVPSADRGIVPGNLLAESAGGGRNRATFALLHQNRGVDLMAGPYRVTERDVRTSAGRPVTVRTYFHPEIASHAEAYLDASRSFIDRYDALIGPYPYTIFSVVSSPTPTGFGMPALTYLGVEVLRLPFIRDTSLGHEVLHNWWGNGVLVDYARGNWSEGLTTFMADYAYREQAGEEAARAMRIDWLRDLAAVPPADDRPVAAFTARHHGASQIIGYHKIAMIFLMLRDEIGRDAFNAALRGFWSEHRFRAASWEDLRRAFEAASKKDLTATFTQWLTRTGLPDIRIDDVVRESAGAGHRLRITLAQSSPPFTARVPIVIATAAGMESQDLMLDATRQTFSVSLMGWPTSIALDPDFRMLRRLAESEAPPILRQVMLDAQTTLIVPTADPAFRTAASDLATKFLDHPARLGDPDRPPANGPLLVMSRDGDADTWLTRHGFAARPDAMPTDGTARVWATRSALGLPVVVIIARDAEALGALARPLPHYGRQSWLVVDGQKVMHRGVWPARPQSLAIQ